MILSIEVKLNGEWKRVGEVRPGDPPGSMSHNHPDGRRDIIVFGFEKGGVIVSRAGFGADMEVGPMRAHTSSVREVVAHLAVAGDSHEFIVTTDRSPVPRQIRLVLRDG